MPILLGVGVKMAYLKIWWPNVFLMDLSPNNVKITIILKFCYFWLIAWTFREMGSFGPPKYEKITKSYISLDWTTLNDRNHSEMVNNSVWNVVKPYIVSTGPNISQKMPKMCKN